MTSRDLYITLVDTDIQVAIGVSVKVISCTILFLLPSLVFAGSVSISGSNSTDSKTTGVALGTGSEDWDKKADSAKDTVVGIDLSYSATNAKAADVGNTQVDDKTTDTRGSAVWSFTDGLRAGLGIATTTASADNIYGAEGSLILGYRYKFSPPPAKLKKTVEVEKDFEAIEVESSFIPSIALTIKAGKNSIQQRTAGRRSAAMLALEQSWTEFILDLDLLKWATLFGSYKKYKYNKDINEILQFLDHPAVQNRTGPAFGNSIATLEDNSVLVGLTFHLGDFDVDLSSSKSKIIATDTYYVDNAVNVTWFWNKWALTLGGGQSKSDTDSAVSYSNFGVRYSF